MRYYFVRYIIGDDKIKSEKEVEVVLKKIRAIARKLKATAEWSINNEDQVDFMEVDKSKFKEL